MVNYQQAARQAARRYGLDPNVFARQIQQESGYNPNARSPAGAIGIAQFMPATARGLGVNPNNPVQALDAAAKLMAGYVQKFGSYKNALVAYNAGPGTVGKALPQETQNYVKTILGGQNPKVGRTQTYGSAPSRHAATGPDPRRQIALSLLGFGNLTGGYSGGGDPLTTALLQASQQRQAPPRQQAYGGAQPVGSAGVTRFDGKPVASWIAPILKQARATGLWKGSVTSGERTKAQQLSAAKHFGLQNYGPKGPLASNHVYGNAGAVDVSDPQGLKRALAALHTNRLRSAMPNDPVHFSRSGY